MLNYGSRSYQRNILFAKLRSNAEEYDSCPSLLIQRGVYEPMEGPVCDYGVGRPLIDGCSMC